MPKAPPVRPKRDGDPAAARLLVVNKWRMERVDMAMGYRDRVKKMTIYRNVIEIFGTLGSAKFTREHCWGIVEITKGRLGRV